MASSTSFVYVSVIQDVVNKVREEFVNNGTGEDVLKELQRIWEAKMMQAGVVNSPIDRSAVPKLTPGGSITPVHDLNMPYEATEEFETPSAELLFPLTPLQTPIQTPLPGTSDNSMHNIPTGPNDYPTSATDAGGEGSANNTGLKSGRPNTYMQPHSSWVNQRAPLDVNIAYAEGRDEVGRVTCHKSLTQDFFTMPPGKRKRDSFAPQYNPNGFIPQQDGANDAASNVFEIEVSVQGGQNNLSTTNRMMAGYVSRSSQNIPQLDGPIPDPYDDALSTPNVISGFCRPSIGLQSFDIDCLIPFTEAPAGTPAIGAQNDTGVGDDDDDEPPLNENDDDDEDLDDVEQGEEPNTQHLVLAQFDKVTRTKSRWKCVLKDGIMQINEKDILFNKAAGEFEF